MTSNCLHVVSPIIIGCSKRLTIRVSLTTVFPKAVICSLLTPKISMVDSSAHRNEECGGFSRVKFSLFAISSRRILTWLPVSSRPCICNFLICP